MPDVHGNFNYPSGEELAAMEPRIRAFIFPSVPRTCDEIRAFNDAVRYQIDHEKTLTELTANQALPNGTQSFRIGDFNMAFEDGAFASRLNRKTICGTAYGILLQAGLLYKGVEGRYAPWD